MTCLQCGGTMDTKSDQTLRYTAIGLPNIVLAGISVSTCRECGHREVEIPRIVELHRLIAADLAVKPSRFVKEEIRFLRKFLGFSQADLAETMEVAPETVSRWESGATSMTATTERFLRLLVGASAIARTYSLRGLPRLSRIAKPLRMKLRTTGKEWLSIAS